MPIDPKASTSENIRELHTGNTYYRTKKWFGKKRADRQAVAIALNAKRTKKGRKSWRKSSTSNRKTQRRRSSR